MFALGRLLVRALATPRGFAILFVALGTALRVGRYALNSPLWWNEAFLAVNFLKRDFGRLLAPLDYNQVCPPGFLWAELAIIRLWGFSEATLRLLPLLASMAALFSFSRAALRLNPGWPGAVAVALLAVAFHPIRLGSEVKPYAIDLLAAALILELASSLLSRPRTVRATLWLAALAPILIFSSYPSLLILAPTTCWIGWQLWSEGDKRQKFAWSILCSSVIASFLSLQVICARGQSISAASNHMSDYWAEGFPSGGVATLWWLVRVQFGDWMSFPVGNGGICSAVSVGLMAVGVFCLLRNREVSLLTLLLGPFLAGLLAGIVGRYPYGVHPRLAQYLMPSVALFQAVGLAAIAGNARVLRFRLARSNASLPCLACCVALLGIVPLLSDLVRPYRTSREHAAREFARRFWPAIEEWGPVHCLRWDDGVAHWESVNPDVALYLCNQAIYSPARRQHRSAGSAARHVLFWSPGVEASTFERLVTDNSNLVPEQIVIVPDHGVRSGKVAVFRASECPGHVSSTRTMLQSYLQPSGLPQRWPAHRDHGIPHEQSLARIAGTRSAR